MVSPQRRAVSAGLVEHVDSSKPDHPIAAPLSRTAPKILLYSHDTCGLGNIRRTLLLAAELIARFPRAMVLIVTGSPMIHAFRIPERTDYIKLPSLDGTNADHHTPKSLGTRASEAAAIRRGVLQKAILGFGPDLVIVDKRPSGVGGELLAVARFHRCAVPDAPAFNRFDPDRLSTAARIVASVRPDLADVVMDLARHLVERTPARGASACLHGDLHPKNALVCGSRVALLDLEDLAIGPAACDIGSFLGALEYSRTADALPPETCVKRAAAFLEGYEMVAALPDRASLGWCIAASLFVERAVRAVTRIRPLGLNQLPALVDRAGQILEGDIDAVGWGDR